MSPTPNPRPTSGGTPARPRQVTVAVGLGVVGSLFLVLSLFDTLGSLSTPDQRQAIERFLSRPPGDTLDLDVAQVIDVMRGVVFVSGALAAVALVCGVFVFQRHAGARVAFTVAAVLLLPTVFVTGVMPFVLAAAAMMMWSRPGRDWFAGREPAPARATPPPATPPPTPQAPFPSPPASGAEAPAPHPYAAPWPPTPAAVVTDPPAPAPWAPAPDPALDAGPGRCPTNVVVAVVLTWVGAAGAALVTLLAMIAIGSDPDQFLRAFDRAAEGTGLSLTRNQVLAAGWVVTAVLLAWSLVAAVLGVLVLRRQQWARVLLAGSALATMGISLLMILSIVSAVSLLLAAATTWLLFTRTSNDWFAGRARDGSGPPAPPAYGYPPAQAPPSPPPSYGSPPEGPPQGRNKPW